MFDSRFKGFLAIALLAAGCSTAPLAPSVAPLEDAAPAIEPGGEYGLQSLGLGFLKIDNICASSTKSKWFPASHVTDGNTHTAWAPDKCDTAPTLTLDLCGVSVLDGIWIKQSGCHTKVDVQVWIGNGWQTIACITPTAAVLGHFDLQGVGTRVRLVFNGCDPCKLLVCDVRLCGQLVPVPVPIPSIPMPPT
jgi:hypothetical protein